MQLFNFLKRKQKQMVVIKPQASRVHEGFDYQFYDGGKFFGGFGPTTIWIPDYYTLRTRSAQLFKENGYARGLIRRLVTNEINTGLTPEVIPNENLLGLEEDELAQWSETVEDRFAIWAEDAALCDTKRQADFGEVQRIVRAESLIIGDVLVVMRLDRTTGLPRVQVISGDKVVSPLGTELGLLNGTRIEHGVELNQFGQQIAYHVINDDGASVRIPARGAKTGRKVAWLVYGTDKRIGEVRGEPLLSLYFQSLKEIDRYRDATQRKAEVNATIAIFMKKTQDKMGTNPMTSSAVRKTSLEINERDGTQRKYNIARNIPGLAIEDLQVGEEPVAFGNAGTDTSFGEFESAIIQAIAWANELPPEILQLSFSSNYSASQAAINEFKNYLNKFRKQFGATFCKPIYKEWLLSEVLAGRVPAPGLIKSWRDPLQFDIFGAWIATDWSGAIKPSTDIKKQAQGYELMVNNGWMTNDRAAKELTGTKYSRNIRILTREQSAKVNAGLVAPVVEEDTEVETLENEEAN